MINPNQETSEEVLRLLKEGSYERMRVELKNSVEAKMRDFDITWEDLGLLLEIKKTSWVEPFRGDAARLKIIQGQITLTELNTLTHIFSCEPYIIFRPRDPWINT